MANITKTVFSPSRPPSSTFRPYAAESGPAQPRTPIVRLTGVSKIYTQGKVTVRAASNLSLEINRGEFTALCGPSGSGKTTILNLVGGLDFPSAGTVWLEDRNLSTLSRSRLSLLRRDRIGFVFQSYNLIPVLSAYENAEFILALQNIPVKVRRQKVMAILNEVGLKGLAGRRPDELSGGQQQRVAIARAIAPEPAIILADEPTANVDSLTAAALLDIMERLNRRQGITFLFSTHDQRVMDRARRIISLKDGEVVVDKVRR